MMKITMIIVIMIMKAFENLNKMSENIMGLEAFPMHITC